MPGYVIGLAFVVFAFMVFALLLWNSLRNTPDAQQRPGQRRHVLFAAGLPTMLVAAGLILLAWRY